MKLSDMRALSGTEIQKEVLARKKELMGLRFQATVGQLANSSRVHKLKREVAQLLTVAGQQK